MRIGSATIVFAGQSRSASSFFHAREASRVLLPVRRGLAVGTAPGEIVGERVAHGTQVEAELGRKKVAARRRHGVEIGVEHG